MVHNKVEPKNVLKSSKNYIAAGGKVLEAQKLKKKIEKFILLTLGCEDKVAHSF